ncbi:hypothetical protein BT69DRAFT_761562 [Atractiella rhizophila]|nr:hypothetical protein BT69DRAFT_761562 [Atractiella rhizophila]
MTIYSFYLFSPSCTCVYYQNWHPSPNPSPAQPGPEVLPSVSRIVSPLLPTETRASTSKLDKPPTERFSGVGGTLVARGAPTPQPGQTVFDLRGGWAAAGEKEQAVEEGTGKGMGFDEECKLIYGVVFSLRTMIKKLNGGKSEPYLAYQTPSYKLHMLHTPTCYTFILTSSPSVDSLRLVLRQLYSNCFLEFVVRNPLTHLYNRQRFELPQGPEGETEEQRRKREKTWKKTSMKEKGERGVDNDFFRSQVDQLIRGLSVFD